MKSRLITLKKYQSLGNDYLVTDDYCENFPDLVQKICHRNYGFGSDGVLAYQFSNKQHQVKIYNPDGSLAEISGNGLRILARYLWDEARIQKGRWIPILTDGGEVKIKIDSTGDHVQVFMGRLTPGDFRKNFIKESLEIKVARARQSFDFYRASIGNPHAVILCDKAPGEEYVKIYGPLIERHKYFEDRTNVQFVYVKNSKSLQLKIWERGAGYTLSSGSSASAAAGIAYHLRLIKNEVKVYMPGGVLDVSIADDLTIVQSGPVSFIGSCQFLYQ